jgi:molybdenum cofactor guanylyltransferase
MTTDLAAYILAGGKSSRFGAGRDKARALVNDRPMILHVAEQVRPLDLPMTAIAARADEYADLGLRTIADRLAGKGPLSGLHAALFDSPCEWVLLLSCDLVGLKTEWVQTLVENIGHNVDAIAFAAQRWEPMPALYRRSLIGEVERRLADDELAMHRLLDAIAARRLPRPGDWTGIVQVNTEEDLADYVASTARQ